MSREQTVVSEDLPFQMFDLRALERKGAHGGHRETCSKYYYEIPL